MSWSEGNDTIVKPKKRQNSSTALLFVFVLVFIFLLLCFGLQTFSVRNTTSGTVHCAWSLPAEDTAMTLDPPQVILYTLSLFFHSTCIFFFLNVSLQMQATIEAGSSAEFTLVFRPPLVNKHYFCELEGLVSFTDPRAVPWRICAHVFAQVCSHNSVASCR